MWETYFEYPLKQFLSFEVSYVFFLWLPVLQVSHLRNHCLIQSQFSSVQLLSRVKLFATLWTAAHQAFRSITNSRSLLKLMSIEVVMPSNHLILSSTHILKYYVLLLLFSKYFQFFLFSIMISYSTVRELDVLFFQQSFWSIDY